MLENLFIFCALIFYQIPSLIILSIISNVKNTEVKKNLKLIFISSVFLWIWFLILHLFDRTSPINKLLEWFQ